MQVYRYCSSALEVTEISILPHFGRKDTDLNIVGMSSLMEVELSSLVKVAPVLWKVQN